jgi:hypothetical protein
MREMVAGKLEQTAASAPELARTALRDVAESEDFGRWFENPDEDYPVMVVPDVLRAEIGGESARCGTLAGFPREEHPEPP